jgi:DNA-binding CsgD family transcriptional regulator
VSDYPLDRLHTRQKEILRLVYQNFEAKQIAKTLGISPHTVNDHMRTARRTLGVARTMDAARLLVQFEHPNWMRTEPIGVGLASETGDEGDATSALLPTAARRSRYRLGPLVRIVIIVALAFGVAAATGALIEAADVITRLITTQHLELSDHPHQR